jgi:hypothetical protein
MLQSPDTFGRIVAKTAPPFRAQPFETMWTSARAGKLQVGDAAPDFRLPAPGRQGHRAAFVLSRRPPVERNRRRAGSCKPLARQRERLQLHWLQRQPGPAHATHRARMGRTLGRHPCRQHDALPDGRGPDGATIKPWVARLQPRDPACSATNSPPRPGGACRCVRRAGS